MRNILAHIPHKDKDAFAQNLKTIWLAPTKERACRLAEEICRQYEHRFSKAIRCLEDGLEDSLSFYAFPLQKSPSQPHLHAVLAPPCRSFSPTFTH